MFKVNFFQYFQWGNRKTMVVEAKGDRVEIKKLCRERGGFGDIHRELFQYHHKREFFRQIHDGVLPIAWHP